MKKFLLTLAAVAIAASTMIAQTNTPATATMEEPDRVQMKALSKNPTGMDIPTGYDKPQVVAEKKHECKDHKDGQPCTKPADQQCPDCKEKAAAAQQCKKGEGHKCENAEGMKHECKEGAGHKCEKAEGMKHECKEGAGHKCEKAEGMKHECKEGAGHKCEKAEGMKHECKEGAGHKCEKEAKMMKHECKEGQGKQCEKEAKMKKHEECKDHKDGQPCNKPADQQCPDCKEKAKKN